MVEVIETATPNETKSDAELYLELSAPRDIEVPSGALFRVRCLTQREYGEFLGGIPAMMPKPDPAKPRTPKEEKELFNEVHERALYGEFVDGLVDRTTGKVTKIPFESVLVQDGLTLGQAVMNGAGGLDTPKAGQDSGGRFENVDFCLQLDSLAERYGRTPAERLGVDPRRELELANVTDWTVFARASMKRDELERAERERLGIVEPPRALSRQEIQEKRVRLNDAFEEMDRKTRAPDA